MMKKFGKLLNSENKVKIEDEIADVLLNIFRFSEMYNVDLSTALKNKIEKSEKKYPIDKCKGKNKKYNEY